jgi:NAD(P)-dependent dehydrogenase (short-subunit alcohol dehydrogenase family)
VVDEARRLVGPIDILVNNAGSNNVQRVESVTDEAWDGVLALNVTAAMATTRAVAADFRSRGWGRVLNISSIGALRPLEGRISYASSKAAMIGLTRSCAVDLGRFGVTVNAIAPGFFSTELTAKHSESVRSEYIERSALHRLGNMDELLGPVLMFVSEAGAYITGQTLVVDGGWLLG